MKTTLLPLGGHSSTSRCHTVVVLSSKTPSSQLQHGCPTPPHSETPSPGEGGDVGNDRKAGSLLPKAVITPCPDPTAILDVAKPEEPRLRFWVLPPRLPYDFCFPLWVAVPTSQLAARGRLQVITKTGIRLHRNSHVCGCCYLSWPSPPRSHHVLFSQVWHL